MGLLMSDFFKIGIFKAIQRKYKSREHHWKPQPGMEMSYKTIKGLQDVQLQKAIMTENFTIEKLVLSVDTTDGGAVKFILEHKHFIPEDGENGE